MNAIANKTNNFNSILCRVFFSLKYEKKSGQKNDFNQMIEIDRTVVHFIGRNPIGHNVIFDMSNKLISKKIDAFH